MRKNGGENWAMLRQEWESGVSTERAIRELRSELGFLRQELKAAEASLRRDLAIEAQDIRATVWIVLAIVVEAVVLAAGVAVSLLK